MTARVREGGTVLLTDSSSKVEAEDYLSGQVEAGTMRLSNAFAIIEDTGSS